MHATIGELRTMLMVVVIFIIELEEVPQKRWWYRDAAGARMISLDRTVLLLHTEAQVFNRCAQAENVLPELKTVLSAWRVT